METKFNFNSSACTSREQSERLLALGIRNETADMTWFRRSKNADWESSTISYKEWVEEILPIVDGYTFEDIIPAWSLHRLIEMTHKNTIDNNAVVLSRNQTYDQLIDRIARQIKEECFNKDYLENGN